MRRLRAATLALALRERLPGYAIVVTCSDPRSDGDTIDRASVAVTTIAFEALFAPAAAAYDHGVHIDRAMVRRIARAFRVRATADGGVLEGPR